MPRSARSAGRSSGSTGPSLRSCARERTETATGRIAPLSPHALEVLRAVPPQAGPHLVGRHGAHPFAGGSSGRKTPDRAIAELAGEPMPAWTVHDLRRSAKTALQRLGARLEVIETGLGHVSGSRLGIVGTCQRHDLAREARAALVAWSEQLRRLLAGEDAAEVLPFWAGR